MEEIDISSIYDQYRLLETITIEVCNQCNWNCKHCYLDAEKDELDPNTIYKIIDDARALGAFEIRLSGGEATIYPYLEQVITYARKRYMNVTLLSNMSMLSENVGKCICGNFKIRLGVF